MAFPLTAAEINLVAGRSESPNEFDIAKAFMRQAEQASATPDKADAWRLLSNLLNMHFEPHKRRQPFSALGALGNSRNLIPDDLTDDQAAELRDLVPSLGIPSIRARLADTVWLRLRHADTARSAVDAYLDAAREVEDPEDWPNAIGRVERAIRIGRLLGVTDKAYVKASEYVAALADRYRGEDSLFLTGRALELMLEFGLGDPDRCIAYAATAAEGARQRKNFQVRRYYLDLLSKWHLRLNNQDSARNALRDLAITFEDEAEQREAAGESLAAAHFLRNAIEAHRRLSGSHADVERIRPRLQKAEQASLSQFKPVSTQLDIGDAVAAARKLVSGLSKADAIRQFCTLSRIASVADVRQKALDLAKRFPLQNFVGADIVDRQGRTVGRRPPLVGGDAAAEEGAIFARMVEHMALQRHFRVITAMIPAFNQLTFEHAVIRHDVAELIRFSAFVPPSHLGLFIEGLTAGFNEDLVTAVHLLVPQIENSLRHLMNGQGIVTTTIDQEGLQREINLNELVVDDRLRNIIGDDILFELRALLTDNRGPNLRNRLAHGMVDDTALMSTDAIYAWWLVLVLCFITRIAPPPSTDTEITNRPA